MFLFLLKQWMFTVKLRYCHKAKGSNKKNIHPWKIGFFIPLRINIPSGFGAVIFELPS